MPKFRVLMRVEAYVDYETEVFADDPHEAANTAYENGTEVVWKETGTQQFDARRIVTLDDHGNEIDATARGKG